MNNIIVMDKIIGIMHVLETLKTESMRSSNTEVGARNLMKKYGMLFLGDNLNKIYSSELCYVLTNKFQLEISLNELNEILPSVCKSLSMLYLPIKDADHKLHEYQIILF